MAIDSAPPGKLTIELAVHRIHDDIPISCPLCKCDLHVHQPDPEAPERLLATCQPCKVWYLIDGSKTTMIQLPR